MESYIPFIPNLKSSAVWKKPSTVALPGSDFTRKSSSHDSRAIMEKIIKAFVKNLVFIFINLYFLRY